MSQRSTPSDRIAEALQWVEAHCRFVRTNLPRGELGVSFADELLAALPDACRRRVPDLTGTAPELLRKAVEYGLLTEVPSARVVRAVPRLVAGLTPAMQLRGSRHWTLWIVHLLDPGMQVKIRRKTPSSQLAVCGPERSGRPRSRAELAIAYRELSETHAREQGLVARLRGEKAELESMLRDANNALEAMGQMEAEWRRMRQDLEEKSTRIAAVARRLEADVVQVQSDLTRVTGERAAAHASLDEMRVELDRARAHLGEERGARERSEAELLQARAALGQERAARERAEAGHRQARATLGQERAARERAEAEHRQARAALGQERTGRQQTEAELAQSRAALEEARIEVERMRVSREEVLTNKSEGDLTLALFAGVMDMKFKAMTAEIAEFQRRQRLTQLALDRMGGKLIGLGYGLFVEQVRREHGVVISGR